LEEYSAVGISVGLGAVHHHLFFQIRSNGLLPGGTLLSVFDHWQDYLTYVVVGQLGDLVRVFIPFQEGGEAREIAKSMCDSIQGRIGHKLQGPDERKLAKFGVGHREAVLSDGKPTFVGFVF
jgi:hypothetical protein